MDKWIWGILVFTMVAAFAVPSAAVQNEVHLVLEDSNATYGNTAEVELWVNATEFAGGQINLTYEPACANVTDWVLNTSNFNFGGWTHYEDRAWITFSTCDPQPPLLTGEYMVGTLTIQCVNASEDGCETALAFVAPSRLLNDTGFPVTATWVDGTFSCLSTQTQSYVVSSSASGKEKNSFNPSTDNVYCYAGNLTANTTVDIYVVANKTDWVVGALLEDVSGGNETVHTNDSGGIWPPQDVWSSPLTPGQYDIVIDVNRNGTWDAGEPIDSWATEGFDVIPEFANIAIPAAVIIGLFMLIRWRRRKE